MSLKSLSCLEYLSTQAMKLLRACLCSYCYNSEMKQHATSLAMICVGVGLLGAGAFYLLTREQSKSIRYEGGDTTSSLPIKTPSEVPVLIRESKTGDDPILHTSYDVEFPVIKLTKHNDLAKAASAVIHTFVTDRINEFEGAAKEEEDRTELTGPESSLMIRYTPLLVSPTIISIRFDVSEYWSGAAHPNSQTMVFNYDLESRTILATEGLFASTSEALPAIALLAKTSLHEQFADISDDEFREQVFAGIVPTLENFRSIAITKEGLTVIFDPYQVAAYARGTQEVRIPIKQVEQLVTKRVFDAISLAKTNIAEATPLE